MVCEEVKEWDTCSSVKSKKSYCSKTNENLYRVCRMGWREDCSMTQNKKSYVSKTSERSYKVCEKFGK